MTLNHSGNNRGTNTVVVAALPTQGREFALHNMSFKSVSSILITRRVHVFFRDGEREREEKRAGTV